MVDFLAIQETKLEDIPESIVSNIWGNCDYGWSFLPATGNSGGILSIWNKVKASLVFTFMGDGFVGVCLDLLLDNRRCYIVNVYASCHIRDKRRLWNDICMSKRGFGDGLWCVVGDFNSVRNVTERKGVRSLSQDSRTLEMREFDDFLESLELVDLPLVGRKYTWFHPNGISMSRLDRVLISSSWFGCWGDPMVRVLERDVADHCSLVLRYSSDDWGPKPFRFKNCWLQSNDFKEVVRLALDDCLAEGWMSFVLKEKLKSIKGAIRAWSVEKFGEVGREKNTLIKKISDLDVKSESTGLIESEVVERKKMFQDLWRLLKNAEALTFQRS
jgi:hypothetical protein